MKIGGIGGHLTISTSARVTARTAQANAASARSRTADNESLQRLGLFLQEFRGRLDEARHVMAAPGIEPPPAGSTCRRPARAR